MACNLRALMHAPHSTLAHLAQTHGPLISLRLGQHQTIIASSSTTAESILKTHDRDLSGRVIHPSYQYHLRGFIEHSLVWSQPNDQWRKLRRILHSELLGQRMMKAQAWIREKKVVEMVNGLKERKEGGVVDVGQVVFETMLSLFCELVFSCGLDGLEMSGSELKKDVWRFMEFMGKGGFRMQDHVPFLVKLFGGGKRDNNSVGLVMNRVIRSWEGIITRRRSMRSESGRGSDFLDILLGCGYSDIEINVFLLEILAAGTDTTATTIEWAMSELIKHPKSMSKLNQELQQVVLLHQEQQEQNQDCSKDVQIIRESHLPHLHHLHACINETFRLHPPAPLLPHYALNSCQLMGYEIPKGYPVIVNIWAIGRDPEVWKNPLEFLPERFCSNEDKEGYWCNNKVEYNGSDFRLIPFGSGRRMCPGIGLAEKVVPLILASLVHGFEWRLTDGMELEDVQMNAKFGLTMKKDPPLLLLHKVKN
ncbi:probable (S)-N-methylcoclaurine 3'-hydroxylase isozyme 2 [Dioscorea cayenensis subsp. rotundata]|uniref:Probable (S)-N-methylcoclaurine 3'-hydroxylase isozyme 2 n=1 Tax=Dioscorea cayennensis subsp. rotundata TaxID=55577 RepID=A0AB40ATE5_DIOCR|nr:probable (S)-N-methylcoclaurine 3'-hydroxylase isozyme 2 [Dioscorea cayenensis subsp. rotundata]